MARILKAGERVPEFAAPDAEGRVWTRADLAGRPFVLYFYPADETPGCVAEGCAFRDASSAFEALGVPVFGVSRDSPGSHARFARARGFRFPLLSDEAGGMHRAFGAMVFGVLPRRVSYLVGADGRVVVAYESNLRPASHVARMLEAARALAARPESGAAP